MNEEKKVKIPFHDGTTRLVPYGTPIEVKSAEEDRTYLRYAYEDGCGVKDEKYSKFVWSVHPTLVVTTVLAEWINPDQFVEMPRNIGAVVEDRGILITRISDVEWRSESGFEWSNEDVERSLRIGRMKVVHNGYEENGCEE